MDSEVVLVVDDNPALLKMVRTMLQRVGLTPLVASSAREALAVLDECPVDVLLTDVVMPGMNGAELMQEARRRRPELRICCMTAHVREQYAALETATVLAKPFTPRDLVDAVNRSR